MHNDLFRSEIAERLVAVRGLLGHTQIEMSDAAGWGLPTLKDYEGGKSIPGGKKLAGLLALGINVNWVLSGEGPPLLRDLSRADSPTDYVLVDPFETDGGAPPFYLYFHPKYVERELGIRPTDLAYVVVGSDTMTKSMPPGTIIIIDRSQTSDVRDGVYYVAIDNRTRTFRRFQLLVRGRIEMAVDNDRYRDEVMTMDEWRNSGVTLLGRVVWTNLRS